MSKILLVDDDVDLAELIETKLKAEGHQLFIINTGEGAFEYAKQVKPDMCILDIMLPSVTGYQICRKIRKDPELYRIAILILTALGEEPEILHGLEQGADDYLVKPFRLERLMDKIASLQALIAAVTTRNRLTNLPGTDAIKREINHQLARGMDIAAVYIDIFGFKPFCAARGQEGQRRVLEFAAQMLLGLTRDMGIYECFISHMGGEHFVVLLKLEDSERFCSSLATMFDQRVRTLYTPQEVEQGFIVATDKRGKEVRCPLMALSIGVAHTQFRNFKSAKKMFEVLAQVRQMAQPGKSGSVVFVDRRHADR
ncbi:MAG: response regulator [Candidatus Hydrogenedentes bacterium]|nr:response regulator [Candidatus Hydrogenedentota bacterium]MBI3117271.1 response regulator [Candidatus Hydrogenedentota bacterium]